jgi:hypothetical protein
MIAHLRTVLLVDVLSAAHYLELPTLMRHVAALIAPHVSGTMSIESCIRHLQLSVAYHTRVSVVKTSVLKHENSCLM